MLKAVILEGHDVPQCVLLVEAPTRGANECDALTVPKAVAILALAALLPHGSRSATALLRGMRQRVPRTHRDAVHSDRRLIVRTK